MRSTACIVALALFVHIAPVFAGAGFPPDAPTVNIGTTTSTSIEVLVTSVDPSVTSYEFRISSPMGMVLETNVSPSPTWTFTGLSPTTAYIVRTVATNDAGDSPPVDLLLFTEAQPSAPASPSLVTASGISLMVETTPGATNGATISGYEFRIATTPSMIGAASHPDLSSSLSRTFTGLTPGADYYVDVRALVLPPDDDSNFSAPAGPFTTLVGVPAASPLTLSILGLVLALSIGYLLPRALRN